MQDIQLKKLLSKDFVDLPRTSYIRSILDHMTEKNHSCVIIVEDNKPIGIVTERDIVKILQHSKNPADLYLLTAAEVMSSPVINLNQNQSLFDALVISRANKIRHFPVVDDDEKLIGLITNTNLASAHFHVVEIQSEMIEKSIARKTEELEKVNEELLALSLEDHLLEVGNRRAMEVDLGHTHATSLRYDQIYSVILLDLDYFKLYNDHYGHTAGDDALRAVANYIKSNVRKSDRLYRYGGEELLLLLPSTELLQAQVLAKKLVDGLAAQAIPHSESPLEVLTISAGLACVSNNLQVQANWEDTVEQADMGLYLAKEQGRNQTAVAEINSPDLKQVSSG